MPSEAFGLMPLESEDFRHERIGSIFSEEIERLDRMGLSVPIHPSDALFMNARGPIELAEHGRRTGVL